MTVSQATILVRDGEPAVMLYARPRDLEELPPLVFVFEHGPEQAAEDASRGIPVAMEFYARDDDLSHVHGRSRIAFYSFASASSKPLTVEQVAGYLSRGRLA